jgi:hypothetical protein
VKRASAPPPAPVAPAPAKPDEKAVGLAAQVNELVAQLGAKDAKDRDEAQKKLLALARTHDIVDLLQKHATDADAEIRTRTAQVLKDAEWGEAAGGVQLRLKAEKREWKVGEGGARFLLDLANRGPGDIIIYTWFNPLTERNCVVEVDGQWYGYNGPPPVYPPIVVQPQHLPAGQQKAEPYKFGFGPGLALFPKAKSAADISGPPDPDSPKLSLEPGKHTVRAALVGGITRDKAGPLVSNPVEIEILPAAAEAPAGKPAAAAGLPSAARISSTTARLAGRASGV